MCVLIPCSSAAISPNGLNVEPACIVAPVAELSWILV